MKTKFDVGDHVLIPFEVEKITITDDKTKYTLSADFPPFDDEIVVEDEEFIIAKEEQND